VLEDGVYLSGVASSLPLVPTTNSANSFAGWVLLAFRLMEWLAPDGSDQLAAAGRLAPGTTLRLVVPRAIRLDID